MVDDFHGTEDWENFMNGMRQVLPDRPVEDLASGDEIFHTLYDVDDKMQVPGEQWIRTGRTYEKDGYQPKWRAIRDDKGPHHGRHLPQHASGRRMGVGRRSELSRTLCLDGLSRGARLHHLRHDTLDSPVVKQASEVTAGTHNFIQGPSVNVSVPLQISEPGFH